MHQLRSTQLKRFLKDQSRRLKSNKLDLVVVLEDLQYARNVASFFRTADACGIQKIYLTGITPTPPFGKDLRKASRNKEKVVKWKYEETTGKIINKLKKQGYEICALEITDQSVPFFKHQPKTKLCLIAGNEVHGVKQKTLDKCDSAIFIPMMGKGRSLNVHVSLAIVCYYLNIEL